MTAPALAARGVVVRFGGLTAVDGVDLEIEDRTLVGIIGPNGAGKTTFFNALCGLVTPATGRLFVGGADLTRKPAHVFARAGVARTFQTPRVFADMTVAESVRFGLEFAGHRRRAERASLADVPAILDFLGLADFASVPAGAVTPARQRLLEIGMALATRPRVLLLDEVAAGYSGFRILDGFALDLVAGRITAIVGSNGAGKSTLLKALAGLLPREGQATLDGQVLPAGSATAAVRAGLILVAEGRHLFPRMTVLENLQLGGWLLARRERAVRLERALSLFPRLVEGRHPPARSVG